MIYCYNRMGWIEQVVYTTIEAEYLVRSYFYDNSDVRHMMRSVNDYILMRVSWDYGIVQR